MKFKNENKAERILWKNGVVKELDKADFAEGLLNCLTPVMDKRFLESWGECPKDEECFGHSAKEMIRKDAPLTEVTKCLRRAFDAEEGQPLYDTDELLSLKIVGSHYGMIDGCPYCGAELDDEGRCPACGMYDESHEREQERKAEESFHTFLLGGMVSL